MMPEREVVVCSTDEGQQACTELRIFFLLASHGIFYIVNYLGWINGPWTAIIKFMV